MVGRSDVRVAPSSAAGIWSRGGLVEDFAFDLRGPPRLWGVGVRIEPDHRSPSWCQRIGVGTTREEAPANPMGVPALWDQRGRPGTWLGGAVSLGH